MTMAEQRILYPAERTVSEDVLEDFRKVDPTAEILDAGNGYWIAGAVRESVPAAVRQSAGLILAEAASLEEEPATARVARAVLRGFAPIELYTDAEIANGEALRDFRERDWLYRHKNPEAIQADLIARATRDQEKIANTKKRLDNLEAEHKSIHQHVFRGRRGVVVDGLRKESTA